jgi:hypothetical protein
VYSGIASLLSPRPLLLTSASPRSIVSVSGTTNLLFPNLQVLWKFRNFRNFEIFWNFRNFFKFYENFEILNFKFIFFLDWKFWNLMKFFKFLKNFRVFVNRRWSPSVPNKYKTFIQSGRGTKNPRKRFTLPVHSL